MDTDEQMQKDKAARKQAASDKAAQKRKDDFAKAIVEARLPPPPPPPPAPVAAKILSRTEREIEAGRNRVKHFAQIEKARKALPRPSENEGGSVPVFRPSDYVPNMSQGKNKATSLKG